MFSLTAKLAFVTGAGSGIGAAIATAFARAGATVLVGDRDPVGGAATVATITAAGGSARFIAIDIADEASVAAAFAAVGAPLDILVNNAGVGCVGTVLETAPADLDRLLAVNVRGTFLVTRAFLPAMLARRAGSVINLASVAGVIAVRDRFAYTTSKFAVVGLTKALALDHSHTGVRFNAICPGRVETPWLHQRLAEYPDDAQRAAYLAAAKATQLAGRMIRPDEVAAAALYLAADVSAMVTGSELMIDGGWTAGK